MYSLLHKLLYFLCFTVKLAENIQSEFFFMKDNTAYEKIMNCMSDMLNNIGNANILFISNKSDIILTSSNPTIILSNNSLLTTEIERIDVYVATFHTTAEFAHWLEEIHGYTFWQTSSNFIISILHPGNTTQIFEIAWKYYVINLNIILLNNNELEVYTYYPYQSEFCTVNVEPKLLFSCSDDIPEILFSEKVPKQFNGCPFKLIFTGDVPLVINLTANRNKPREAGFEVTVLSTILTKLNTSQIYITKLSNASNTTLFDTLKRKKVDLICGSGITDTYNIGVEDLNHDFTFNLYWWVPTADLRNPWANLQHIFTPWVWGLIAISIFINAIIWWIFGRNKERVFNNLARCIQASALLYLQSNTKSPETVPLRILFACWLIVIVIFYAACQSQLVRALTKPQYEKQISTVEEIVEKLKFGLSAQGLMYYMFTSNPTDIKIRTSYVICPLNEFCLNRTAYQRDFANLKGYYTVKYFAPKMYTFPDGRPMLFGFESGGRIIPRYIVNKGDPRAKRINPIFPLLFSNGLIEKWRQDITQVNKFVVEPKNIPLSLKHFGIGFLILFVGYALSAIVFVVEVWWYKFKTKF